MITGHEDILDLTEADIAIANRLINALKTRTKDNPILSKDIVNGVNSKWEVKPKFTDVRLRKIINYYRTNSILPVISNKNGYYVSYNIEEIDLMTHSLTQRANSILGCVFGMKRISEKLK